jgi:hypothetical protein
MPADSMHASHREAHRALADDLSDVHLRAPDAHRAVTPGQEVEEAVG